MTPVDPAVSWRAAVMARPAVMGGPPQVPAVMGGPPGMLAVRAVMGVPPGMGAM